METASVSLHFSSASGNTPCRLVQSVHAVKPFNYDGNDKFNVEIGWFANNGFTLDRTKSLTSNNWSAVAGQEFEDNGEPTLILRDPFPPFSNAFYRVSED